LARISATEVDRTPGLVHAAAEASVPAPAAEVHALLAD